MSRLIASIEIPGLNANQTEAYLRKALSDVANDLNLDVIGVLSDAKPEVEPQWFTADVEVTVLSTSREQADRDVDAIMSEAFNGDTSRWEVMEVHASYSQDTK